MFMPKSSKVGAIVLMVVGILVAVFFAAAIVKGGFSGSSFMGVLLGAGVVLWQIRSLKSNESSDGYNSSEEW
jgi:uncharacterized membrane protein YeaQ/YmgE (transglycosylase-associated protein family)